MKIIFSIVVSFFYPILLIAQLDNSAFYDDNPIDSTQENQLNFKFHNLNFTKNNEYFNKIADGYTLFGTQFSPQLTYQPTKNIRLDVGVYMWKDYGNAKFSAIAPLFTFNYQKKGHRFLFGNLQGHMNHRYIEPLFDFERVMVNRLENGIQYLNTGKRHFLDVWINWERMLYKREDALEKVSGGISSHYDILKNEKWVLQIPFQTLLMHEAGQIDFSSRELISVINTAAGISLEYKVNEDGFLKSLKADNYFTHFSDFSNVKEQPYKMGTGFYSNFTINTKYQNLMISYWQGNRFISMQGGQLYPSVSSNIKNIGHTETQRQLLIFRFMHDFKLWENVYLTARFEPYYDFRNKFFEFSHGLYVNYKQTIGITKIKQKID
jgi:hypothetical protein